MGEVCAGVTDATPGVWAAVARRWLEGRGIGRRAGLGDELERSVEPGPESLGQGGVGLVGGRARRVGAGVGGAQPQAEDRQGDHDHRGEGAHGNERLAGFDDPGPAEPEAGAFRARRAAGGQGRPFPPGQDPGPEEPEHGRQEGEGGGHGQGHRDGRAERQAVEEADPEGELAEQGDADGEAGEQHRAARGPHRLGGGVGVGQPGLDRAAVPADDEQPVVDPDAEADQDGQLAGHAGDVERVAEQADERCGYDQRQASGHQGHQRGQQRPAEDDQQDDQRRGDSDHDGHPDAGAF